MPAPTRTRPTKTWAHAHLFPGSVRRNKKGQIIGSTGGRQPVLTIAASDTLDGAERADLVCSGTADDVDIQALIDVDFPAGGAMVKLLEGTFNFTGFIHAEHSLFEGCGQGTLINIDPSGTAVAIVPETGGVVRGIQFASLANPTGVTVYGVGVGDGFTGDPGGSVEDCFFTGCGVRLMTNGSQVLNSAFDGDFGMTGSWYIVDVSSPYNTVVDGCSFFNCHGIDEDTGPFPSTGLVGVSAYGPVSNCVFDDGQFYECINTSGPCNGNMIGQLERPLVVNAAINTSSYTASTGNFVSVTMLNSIASFTAFAVVSDGPVVGNQVILSNQSVDGSAAIGTFGSNPITGNQVTVEFGLVGGVGICLNSGSGAPVVGNRVDVGEDTAIGVWIETSADHALVSSNVISLNGTAATDVQDDGTADTVVDNVTIA